MQSSGLVAFRATIMIVCMIALPLAAVVGTALPKAVQSVIQGESKPVPPSDDGAKRSTGASHSDDSQTTTPAPDATPAKAVAETQSNRLPRARITAIRPISNQAPNVEASEPTGVTAAREHESTASLWSRGERPPAKTRRVPLGAERRPHREPDDPQRGESPAPHRGESPFKATTYSAPIESDVDDSHRAERAGRPAVESSEPPTDDPLSRGERRLRQLGATGYRLETWGVTGGLYRFSCNVALSDQGQATRHFEATDTSPAKAIEAVVKQVEAWDRP
ncbi:MAG TPA: hypothetical protein VND64_03840 [Pirellulales bacterium]|nr:hypothetical protein [Pirellulales bacterium]